MKFKIDEPKTGEKITVEILGRQAIERYIENEVNRKLRFRLEALTKGVERSRENIIVFEKEIIKMRETLEDFRAELYKLQEICIVINKVKEHLEKVEEMSKKISKFEEDMIVFKLRLLKEEN